MLEFFKKKTKRINLCFKQPNFVSGNAQKELSALNVLVC